jgi:hypothetical protein
MVTAFFSTPGQSVSFGLRTEIIQIQVIVVKHVIIPAILLFFFIHSAYNVWVISPPLPPTLTLTPLTPSLIPPYTSLPSRNYFALISNFVEERV